MSTQQSQSLGRTRTYGSIGDKERIATELQIQWFKQVLEFDLNTCNNCFSKREDQARHFRTTGGATAGGAPHEDGTADLFCTACEAGTGKEPTHREYDNVGTTITPGLKSETAGTVGRTWSEEEPLPKAGSIVSLSRLITNVGQRLEELGYTIQDWDAVRDRAESLKDEHPNRDRVILARVFAEGTSKTNGGPELETINLVETE